MKMETSRTLSLGRCLLAFALSLGVASGVSAQTPAALLAELSSDSTAWQRVLAHVVGSLGTYLVRTAADSTRQPWTLEVPENEPQRRLLLRQLRTILRARPVATSDTVTFTPVLGPLTIRNDTARVTVRTDFARRCPDGTSTGGFGNVDSVFVPRSPPGAWGAARSARVLHGDRAACRGPW